MNFKKLTFSEKEQVLKDLSGKIAIVGACWRKDQYLHIILKRGANMNNVKSILRKQFEINYRIEEDALGKIRFADQNDIEKLCRIFLEFNIVDLDYHNRFDPLGEKNTIAKRVYQYGTIRYDLLHV